MRAALIFLRIAYGSSLQHTADTNSDTNADTNSKGTATKNTVDQKATVNKDHLADAAAHLGLPPLPMPPAPPTMPGFAEQSAEVGRGDGAPAAEKQEGTLPESASAGLAEKSAETGTSGSTLEVSDAELQEIFDEVDFDKDGVVTPDELWKATEEEFELNNVNKKIGQEKLDAAKATLKKNLADADTDQNGKLTKAELKSFLQVSHGILDELGAAIIGDDDEDEDDDERKAGSLAEKMSDSEDEEAKIQLTTDEIKEIFDEADEDKDGILTTKELMKSTAENFDLDDEDEEEVKVKEALERNLANADEDKNGQISPTELQSYLQTSHKILHDFAEEDDETEDDGDDSEVESLKDSGEELVQESPKKSGEEIVQSA